MRPRETLTAFDDFLTKRRVRLEAVIIGGAALSLLGIVSRPTKDCDVLHPRIPDEVQLAARDFAVIMRDRGEPLQDDWLNNGPETLAKQLPPGWEARLQVVFAGEAILLRSLGRVDLLRSKLFALCDRAIDLADCIALCPSSEELEAIRPWLEEQDLNPDWPAHVRQSLRDLQRKCGHGV